MFANSQFFYYRFNNIKKDYIPITLASGDSHIYLCVLIPAIRTV